VSEETRTRLETITAPFGREVRLEDVEFESGMRLMRVTIREGQRFTILDIDAHTAAYWSDAMKRWAERNFSDAKRA
jgi:hypothetical protein